MVQVRVVGSSGANASSRPDTEAVTTARRLLTAAEQADGRPPVSDQAVIAAAQGRRELVTFTADVSQRIGAGNESVAAAADSEPPAAVGIVGEGELDLVVRPDVRGRGIGTAALTELLRRADAAPGELRAWAHGENPAADAMLARSGFAPVRELLRMTLDPALLPAPPEVPAIPANYAGGFHTAAFEAGSDEQAAEWVRVNAAAFANHPEQGAMTLGDFQALAREGWFDPADLMLCYDADGGPENAAGHVAGYAWVKTLREEPDASPGPRRTECELYAIGVHPDFAGKGLGSALTDSVLVRMAEHDPAAVSLYVDGDNERAVGLYRARGFTVDVRSVQWLRRPVNRT